MGKRDALHQEQGKRTQPQAVPGEVQAGHEEQCFFTERMIRHWDGLPRKVWSHQPWKCSKKKLDVALSTVV